MAQVGLVKSISATQSGVWRFHFKVNVDEEDAEVTYVYEVLDDRNTDFTAALDLLS